MSTGACVFTLFVCNITQKLPYRFSQNSTKPMDVGGNRDHFPFGFGVVGSRDMHHHGGYVLPGLCLMVTILLDLEP